MLRFDQTASIRQFMRRLLSSFNNMTSYYFRRRFCMFFGSSNNAIDLFLKEDVVENKSVIICK
jgi:hypothetical protein